MAAREAPRLTLAVVLATAVGEAVVAALLLATLHDDPRAALASARWPFALQALAGLVGGAALAAMQIRLLAASPRWRSFSQAALGGTELRGSDIVLISVAAGVAEELLFRAALQPLIGVWWTSLLFAAVHANYAPLRHDRSDWGFSAAALLTVFGLSVLLGVAYEYAGLAAAVAAHATYDFLVLRAYRRLFGWA
jgi:membrane protease YdiL (CAAX protease family)